MEVKTTKKTTTDFRLIYDDEILDGTSDFIFDIFSKDMDDIFPNKASWTKFLKKVENGELADKLSYKRKNEYINTIGYNTIEVYSDNGFDISTGFILDENNEKLYIYDTYKKIILKISYGFYTDRIDGQVYEVEITAKIEKLEK